MHQGFKQIGLGSGSSPRAAAERAAGGAFPEMID